MAVLLFWNLGRSTNLELVAAACRDHRVEILILAELSPPSSDVLRSLNAAGEFGFAEAVWAPSPVKFFHRLPSGSLAPVFDDARVSIRRVTPPLGLEILIVACHLPSKLHRDYNDQYYTARKLRDDIAKAELLVGHKNSLVIGDLNMNPFEVAMNAADGLHAVMDKRVAMKAPRTINGVQWDYFYNPMWSRMGDESIGPAGTYYRGAAHVADFYWHTFDQVLLRPALLPFYKKEHLRILTEIDGKQLVSERGLVGGFPDHLPILLKLETESGA